MDDAWIAILVAGLMVETILLGVATVLLMVFAWRSLRQVDPEARVEWKPRAPLVRFASARRRRR